MNRKVSWGFDRLYKLDSSKVKQSYSNSASLEGSCKVKNGSGIFKWPNGACYDGEFVENKRHGKGKQEWPDGSCYVGEFQHDVREGFGRHTWYNGEIYEGTFLSDRRHGKGKYYWPNGTQYEGHFFNDLKDGYGCFHFADGKRFEGMYKNNERNGAGILSYCDGRQDVGVWLGEKLIRLCTVMENTFLFQHFSDYFVNAGENVPSKVKRANSALADARTINEVEERNRGVGNVDKTKNNVAFFNQRIPETFPLDDILDGIRNSSHGPKGPCEVASEEFLHVSGKGDGLRVLELLEQGLVHVDVADKTGFTALLAASVNCHKDIINCLLDYGADVNKLNYEGLSPLAACHVLFYTKHTWNENIGEILTKENIFNSVCWDKQSGTFVQRIPVYYQNRTRSKINTVTTGPNDEILMSDMAKKVSNTVKDNITNDGISVKTEENVKPRPAMHSEIVYRKADGGSSPDEDKTNSFVTPNTCLKSGFPHDALDLNCDVTAKETDRNGSKIHNDDTRKRAIEEDFPNDQQDVTSNYQSDPFFESRLEHQASLYDSGHTQPSQRSNIKESIVQRSEIVDKNTFIHVFLNRAASARSKQNSSMSFENVNSYCDNRDEAHNNQDGNSWRVTEESNSRACRKSGNNNLAITVLGPDLQESVQYSMQNAISSSINTVNTVEDAESLQSVEQNRQKLITQQRRPHLEATVRLLLRRGANPNASSLPMPVLFFAIKAADAPAVKILLEKGADTNARLSNQKLGITPLHIAVALPSDAIPISKLLLDAGADPNMRDFAFGDAQGGRTSLHTACCREDNDQDANRVIRLLLDYKADPNLLCNGHSALSLVIGSGNDLAVETLLKGNADPSLSLTHGVGSPLCAAVSFTAERRRKIVDHIRLVNKLLRTGANILAPIIVSDEHPPGTVVDYAYKVFQQAVETLLKGNADPSLSLTHGVGSPLCAAVSFTAERRRKIVDHIRLVNKLLRTGANILAPIIVSDEHPPGTVVDYAYKVFQQDRRIAHTPYHSLTPYEREIYIARRKMLDHLAELLRTHVLKKEKKLLEEQLSQTKAEQEESSEEINLENLDRAVSFYFDETRHEESVSDLGSSFEKASIYDESHETLSSFSLSDSRFPDCGLRVAVIHTPSDHMNVSQLSLKSVKKRQFVRKSRFRYCYECGRSVGVRLAACTRCKEVFYCSRNCKLKAWTSRHKEECIRLSARAKRSVCRRTDSPTSATTAEKDSFLKSNSKDSLIKRQNSRNSCRSSK